MDMSSESKRRDHVQRIIDETGKKRRIYSVIHKDPKQSSRRFRANDRERRRMNSLNGALQNLKTCVPLYHGKQRLTKLQILQFACHYISDLSEILCTSSDSSSAHGDTYAENAFVNIFPQQNAAPQVTQEQQPQYDYYNHIENNNNNRLDYPNYFNQGQCFNFQANELTLQHYAAQIADFTQNEVLNFL